MLERTALMLGPAVVRDEGKVRDLYHLADGRLLAVTTDRLSAFDVVLGTVPHKGQVLNQLAAWWFEQTADLVPSWIQAVPDPNVSVGVTCKVVPVEVVVRGYLTGVTDTSLWRQYDAGARTIYGIDFPDRMAFNDPLPDVLITPTTKAERGGHDRPLTSDEVVETGLVPAARWNEICTTALALFRRGTQVAAAAGLTLVDTKYEFGLDGDRLMILDEMHTPDSSRYWRAGTCESADKEIVRRWYVDELGYRGEGRPPPMPRDLAERASHHYIEVYEQLTGSTFEPGAEPAAERIAVNVARYLDG